MTNGQLGFKGLKTAPNALTSPPGSLQTADNCCILTKDILQPRRGQHPLFKNLTQLTPATFGPGAAVQLAEWKSQQALIVAFVSDTNYVPGYTGGQGIYSSDFQLDAVTFDAAIPPDPGNNKMKFAELAKNLYYTAATGPRVLSAPAGSGSAAGVSEPYDAVGPNNGRHPIELAGEPSAVGSWFTTDNAVGYRSCFVKKDANGNVKLSAPNGRFVVVNPKDIVMPVSTIAIVDATSSTLATATVAIGHNFKVGDKATLLPGEAAFPAHTALAALTITAVTATTVSWVVPAHADTTNGTQQTLSSGTKSVTVPVYLTNSTLAGAISILAGDFVQVYRTDDSGGAAIDPGDEHFLCYERQISAADYAQDYVSISDTTPEAFLGAPLYSNANTGEGALQTNDKPPICNDLCVFDGRMWGAESTDRQSLTARLIGANAPNGFQTGDVLVVGTTAVSATASSGGTITQNVFNTAFTIVGEYSQTSGVLDSGRQAHGVLDAASSPVGQMVFSDINAGGATFYAGTTRLSAFQDPLALVIGISAANTSRLSNVVHVTTNSAHGLATGSTAILAYNAALTDNTNFPVGAKVVTSTGTSTLTYAETGSNGVMSGAALAYIYAATYGSDPYAKQLRFSKQGQPEAWPQANWLGGLPDGAEVLRIAPLQNSLYVFFRHGDIYTVSGSYPYNVQRFDDTATLAAADSLVGHSGRLFALTTQGVCAISSSGVEVLSLDIESDLRKRVADVGNNLGKRCFAVSYESDRQYQLWLPMTDTDQSALDCYVYQSDKAEWTRWYGTQEELSPTTTDYVTTGRRCGLVFKPIDTAIYGPNMQGMSNVLFEESKAYDRADFSDYTIDVAGTLSLDGVLYLTPTTPSDISRVLGGDIIQIGDHLYTVFGIDPTHPGELQINASFIPGGSSPFTIRRTIPELWEWVIDAGGSAGVEKHWREIQLHFKNLLMNNQTTSFSGVSTQPANNTLLVASFSNEQSGSTSETVTVVPPITALDTETGPYITVRLEVPMAMQRAAMLRVSVSIASTLASWQLLGWSKTMEEVSERTGY